MITINWTGTRVDGDDYYKTGEWLIDGSVMGVIETPATSDFEQIIPDSQLIAQLEAMNL